MKDKSSLFVSILNILVALVALAIGAEAIREYFMEYPAEMLGWLFVTMLVIFILAGVVVLILVFSGFAEFIKGKSYRKTVLATTILLIISWLFIPASPYAADLLYNCTADYVRVNAEEARQYVMGYCDELTGIARKRGDRVEYGDWFEKTQERPEFNGRLKLTISSETSGDIKLTFAYDYLWSRLTVDAEYDLSCPIEQIQPDWQKLEKPLEYINAVTASPLAVEDLKTMATNEQYAEYAHDGYSGQLKKLDAISHIRCRIYYASDDVSQYRQYAFTVYALTRANR